MIPRALPRLQIAMLNGRSDPDCWALSPAQHSFLQQLAGPQRHLVSSNFPYLPNMRTPRARPLWQASIANISEYLKARRSGFRQRYRPAFIRLLQQAQHTVFISGSCGLELFNCMALSTTELARVSVCAYGPVARISPACRKLLIQGNDDWISRCWFKQVDLKVVAHHMNYLQQAQVLAACRQFIATIEMELHDEFSSAA